MPPYIDVISGLFSSNYMRKPSAYTPVVKKQATNKFTSQKATMS